MYHLAKIMYRINGRKLKLILGKSDLYVWATVDHKKLKYSTWYLFYRGTDIMNQYEIDKAISDVIYDRSHMAGYQSEKKSNDIFIRYDNQAYSFSDMNNIIYDRLKYFS